MAAQAVNLVSHTTATYALLYKLLYAIRTMCVSRKVLRLATAYQHWLHLSLLFKLLRLVMATLNIALHCQSQYITVYYVHILIQCVVAGMPGLVVVVP
jgi:hypothetical protein